MDIASTLPSQPLLPLVLLLLFLVPGAEAAPNTAGLVVGCVLGTLAFVLLIEGILYCCCFRKRKIKKREAKKRHHQDIGLSDVGPTNGRTNRAYSQDVEAGIQSTSGTSNNNSDFASKGFPGYVQCKEFNLSDFNKE